MSVLTLLEWAERHLVTLADPRCALTAEDHRFELRRVVLALGCVRDEMESSALRPLSRRELEAAGCIVPEFRRALA